LDIQKIQERHSMTRTLFRHKGTFSAGIVLTLGALFVTTSRLSPVATAQPAPVAASQAAPDAAVPASFMNIHALIIVRHADIDVVKKGMEGDVPLLPRGEERAKELAFALKDAGVTRIVTSEALRTKQTAAVLAKELNITPETPFEQGPGKTNIHRKPGDTPIDYIADVGKPADTVLLVYHHSAIPALLKQLGYAHEPAFDDATEFDRIYVVLPDPVKKTYQVMRLRYGGDWHQHP
jgi:phosphohistidine phosphatase SixA